jgi:acetoin utilization deacetylase AcuC-like enzyme
MKIITDIACIDYERPGHPERPQRVSATLDRLKSLTDLDLEFVQPTGPDLVSVELVHPASFVESLNAAEDFDVDTPAHSGIQTHALRAVSGALNAMDSSMAGTPALSLLRPPGHHACAETAMGFCYLNQIAIAAVAAAAEGKRVGILDFDVHHGNGTEAIILGRENLLYASAHQSPAYPGTGMHTRKLQKLSRPT